jgi:hypothetical protein
MMHSFCDNIETTYRLQEIIPNESVTFLIVQSGDKNCFQCCQLEKLCFQSVFFGAIQGENNALILLS